MISVSNRRFALVNFETDVSPVMLNTKRLPGNHLLSAIAILIIARACLERGTRSTLGSTNAEGSLIFDTYKFEQINCGSMIKQWKSSILLDADDQYWTDLNSSGKLKNS